MANYSPGELANFNYVAESTYGTTPTAALVWGCTVERIKPRVNPHQAFHLGSVSRSYSDVTKGAWEVGFRLNGWARVLSGGIDWRDFFARYGLGAINGLSEHLGSFTSEVRFEIGGGYVFWHFNGCKMNSLSISCEGAGQVLKFESDVVARWVTKGTSKTLTGLQSVVVGASATDITAAMLTWNGISQISLGGAAAVDWHPKTWSLDVDNHLEATMANLYGADSQYYHCARDIMEGGRDILFTCTLDLENETYNAAKLAGMAVTSITIPIDDDTITLSNGEVLVENDDLPEFKREIMTQPLRVKFKSIAITPTE